MHFVEGRVWPVMLTPLDESGGLKLEAVERLVSEVDDAARSGALRVVLHR